MVTSDNECEAALGYALQRDVGCDIPDGYDDPVGDLGAWFSGVQ